MKWPGELIHIRHAQSAYNVLKERKREDPMYQEFVKLFGNGKNIRRQAALAKLLEDKYALGCSDRETPITDAGIEQARVTADRLHLAVGAGHLQMPDVIFVSPYKRTRQTYETMVQQWPALGDVHIFYEERIREQDHGLSLLYNDWRIFHTYHPDQAALYRMLGSYDYRFLNGENVPDVRMRIRDWRSTVIREFHGKNVWAFTHHLTILGWRADQERWTPEKFQEVDRDDKPVNCSVTVYRAAEGGRAGKGRLELVDYNLKLY
jgi:broad specificity phosphatase PhoE